MFYILRAHNLPLQMQISSPLRNNHDDLDLVMILETEMISKIIITKIPSILLVKEVGILLAKDFLAFNASLRNTLVRASVNVS